MSSTLAHGSQSGGLFFLYVYHNHQQESVILAIGYGKELPLRGKPVFSQLFSIYAKMRLTIFYFYTP